MTCTLTWAGMMQDVERLWLPSKDTSLQHPTKPNSLIVAVNGGTVSKTTKCWKTWSFKKTTINKTSTWAHGLKPAFLSSNHSSRGYRKKVKKKPETMKENSQSVSSNLLTHLQLLGRSWAAKAWFLTFSPPHWYSKAWLIPPPDFLFIVSSQLV